ncbi:AMP-dependent synthetase/ligase [Streptomyces chryseus]|uniref:Long-chain-fatty-acid--CoA ligase n=3 Tax=Streptomyces chryseus TaxID=68186 RepID=A0ABQ3DPC6_9ACTN|nr:AMP-dependent synthetase/ligase [Streptomyces chryseus]GGX03152.1 long-chain-fatty-acid--CoA ligase [Streptomyces chryseus]GHB06635.1 long-chain-fatty-acid--CoA ligase [Streptomyces chryseus]
MRRPGTLAVFTAWAGDRYGDHPALRAKGMPPVSYAELRDTVRAIAGGLAGPGTGVRAGDRVAILSETRVEWTYAHFAVLAVGAVVVPVYPTAGDEELAWVLGDSGATVVICENAERAARVAGVRAKTPDVRHVLLLDELRPPTGPAASLTPPAPPDQLAARAAAVGDGDLAAIVYTSGTTGLPKGCRLTHGNLGAVLEANLDLIGGGPGDRTYLYLPLAHLLAQLIQFTTLLRGGELCYFGGRIEDVVSELAEVKPTHLPSVPRLFEKVHATVLSLAEGREGGRERFEEAVRIGVLAAEGRLPDELTAAYEEADQRLYSLVRAVFGGRLRWALTGAAPIAPRTMDFLRACGIQVFEGYGMTESGGVISLNHPGAVRYGTVGRPVAGCEVRIAEDGEVLARGPMVFPGYHANEAATRETVDADGWLHTGDLGALDGDGYLTITGRKKDLIITSAGKNLTPTTVEQAVQQQSPLVSHVVMVGDRRPYPVALVTLDAQEVAGWAAREGRDPGDREALRAVVQEAVDAANARVSRPARIRAFAVLDEDFTVDAGVLTPTLKVRRRAVAERYAAEIEALYATGTGTG